MKRRRKPQLHAETPAPFGLAFLRCPCGAGLAFPGRQEWAGLYLAEHGALPPWMDGVPSWAWWCCRTCGEFGVLAPEGV